MKQLAIEPDDDDENIEEVWSRHVEGVRREYLSDQQSYPWIVGYSGGKDSTLVVQAVFEALLSVAPSRRTRAVHIVANDTMVESPLVSAHLNTSVEAIREAAVSLDLPVKVAKTYPDPDKTFWVLLIGKGYPSPNMTMRWCTDRLKIQPTSTYIRKEASKAGCAIVVLGVRKDESQSRKRSIEKWKNHGDSQLSPHDRLPGALIYRPIADLVIEQVWEILGTTYAPWGGDHSSLIKLYRDSEGGECPVVLSSDEAPGCGTSNSRFGCWTCTVVEKDKSLNGFVEAGQLRYVPLIEFRDWLRSIRNLPEKRQAIRRNGKLTFSATGQHIPGPFTIQTRQEIMRRLIDVQEQFGAELISQKEIDFIHRLWAEELANTGAVADV